MMLSQLLEILEGVAPVGLAEEWDNPGLLVEPYEKEISRALVALDCTVEVVEEAARVGAQIILSHHPLFFKPVRRLYYSEPETAAACMLIRRGIGLYAAHTNLDAAAGGVNDALAKEIGLKNISFLSGGEPSCGRIGELEAPRELAGFSSFVRDKLNTAVRYGGDGKRIIRRVAVVGGSGGDFIKDAKEAGADVLLTGEIKHNQALDAAFLDIAVVEAGHYETERLVLKPWRNGLQSAAKAVQCKVDLLEATCGKSPLVAP